MKRIKMPELTTLYGKVRLRIPAGWICNVPQPETYDPITLLSYSRFFIAQKGMTKRKAEKEVVQRMNKLFERAWLRHVCRSIRRYARIYARKFPDRVGKNGILAGFRPDWLQNAYIPEENMGRRGKKSIKEMFGRMGESEKG